MLVVRPGSDIGADTGVRKKAEPLKCRHHGQNSIFSEFSSEKVPSALSVTVFRPVGLQMKIGSAKKPSSFVDAFAGKNIPVIAKCRNSQKAVGIRPNRLYFLKFPSIRNDTCRTQYHRYRTNQRPVNVKHFGVLELKLEPLFAAKIRKEHTIPR